MSLALGLSRTSSSRHHPDTRLPQSRSALPLLSIVAAAFLCVACQGAEDHTDPRPNVLVIVIDTLRIDSVGAYGASRDTTPAIDELASESVLFEKTVTTAPRTWQSLATMLTGLYPVHHGVRHIYDDPLPDNLHTLPSILSGAGYDTAAFGFVRFLRDLTAGRGFATYFDPPGVGGATPDDLLAAQATRWVRRRRTRPFHAFLHFRGPHWPYRPSQEHHDLFARDEAMAHDQIDHSFNQGGYGLAVERGPGFKLVDGESYRSLIFETDTRPAVRAHARLHYDALVRDIDRAVGKLIAAMRRSGLLDRTLVIITSDHGESFGEHGYLQHGPRVDRSVMLVPMIIRFPTDDGHGPSMRVQQLVRTVDILPTVLEFLGMTPLEGLDGQSLLPIIRRGADLDLTAYGESGREFMDVDDELSFPGIAGRQRMLRDRRFKLVLRPRADGPSYSLYDMETDPGESEDVSEAWPDARQRLQEELETLLAGDVTAPESEAQPSAEQIDQLRALGYAE